jgi:RNA polymerase sigma-70 factor (ECF subfamily)
MAARARPDNLSLDQPVGDAGSAPGFDELWEFRAGVRATSQRMVGNDGKADDIVQETFLRALANASRIDRRASFAPWLTTVARRRAIDEIRARKRVRLMAATPEPTPHHASDPLEQVLRQEAVDRVRAALRGLTARERQLLVRQATHGLSLSELAAEEGTTIASVRSVLTRARNKLRAAVEREGPLGTAPLPGLAAAFRRRLRGAVRLDVRATWAGAAAPLGDAAVAAAAAIAFLVGGTVATPTPSGARPAAGEAWEASPALASTASNGKPVPDGSPPPDRKATRTGTTTTTTTQPSQSGPMPDWDTVPTLPVDEYGQPAQVRVSFFDMTSDRQTVFASGQNVNGEDAVLRSDDDGVTWQRLPVPRGAKRLLVPPTYPAEPTLFLVNEATLLRSDDHGAHFYAVAPARGGVAFVPDYAVSKRVLLAGNPVLEYRADAAPGTVRPLLATPASADLAGIASAWDDTILVGSTSVHSGSAFGSAVYACTPTVCTPHATLPDEQRAPQLHRSASSPGAVFAWRNHRVLRSGDHGQTFAPADLPPHNLNGFVDGAPGEVFAVGQSIDEATPGIHRSTDGGASWQALATGTPFARGARAIVRLASGRLLLAALNGIGIHCSDDDGASWAQACS